MDEKKFRRWSIFIGISLPVCLLFFWHAGNASYPKSDSSNYFTLSQEIYLKFQNLGFTEGIKTAFFDRHRKPIIHPVVSSASLFITGGSVLPAVQISAMFWFILFLFYVGKISTSMLPPKISWLPIVLAGSTSWIFVAGTKFSSEIPFLAAAMATFYHLLNLKGFTSKKHTLAFGIWMAISFCMRPIEALLSFLIHIILAIKNSLVSRTISPREVYLVLFFGIFSVACLAIPMFRNTEWEGLSLILLILAAVVIAIGMNRKTSLFLTASTFFILIPFVWFAPSGAMLYEWIYSVNISDFSVITGKREHLTVLDFFMNTNYRLGVAAWILSAVAIIGMSERFKFWKSLPLGMAMSMFVIPLAVGGISTSDDPRYYYGASALFIAGASIAALQAGNYLKTRVAIVSLIALLQFFNCLNYTFRLGLPAESLQVLLGKPYWNNPFPEDNEGLNQFQAEIKNKIGEVQNTRFVVLPLSPRHIDFKWRSESGILTIRSRELGLLWTFDRLDQRIALDLQAPFPDLQNKYDYVLVGPLNNPMDKKRSIVAEVEAKLSLVNDFKLIKIGTIHSKLNSEHSLEYLMYKTGRVASADEDHYH